MWRCVARILRRSRKRCVARVSRPAAGSPGSKRKRPHKAGRSGGAAEHGTICSKRGALYRPHFHSRRHTEETQDGLHGGGNTLSLRSGERARERGAFGQCLQPAYKYLETYLPCLP